jgi:hypothetical protein
MVDRVKCAVCGAESFAGPNLNCHACFNRLKTVHDGLVAENANLHVELGEKQEVLRQLYGLEAEEVAQTLVRLQQHVNMMSRVMKCGHPAQCLVWPDGENGHAYCNWCADLENGKAELARLQEALGTPSELWDKAMHAASELYETWAKYGSGNGATETALVAFVAAWDEMLE